MKKMMRLLFASAICSSAILAAESHPSSLTSEDNFAIEQAAFSKLGDTGSAGFLSLGSGWLYDGDSETPHLVSCLDEQKLLMDMVGKAEPHSTLSVLDYGAGQCKSNDGYLQLFAQPENAALLEEKDLHINLVAVTGDKLAEETNPFEEHGRVKSYKLEKFFIANLDEDQPQ